MILIGYYLVQDMTIIVRLKPTWQNMCMHMSIYIQWCPTTQLTKSFDLCMYLLCHLKKFLFVHLSFLQLHIWGNTFTINVDQTGFLIFNTDPKKLPLNFPTLCVMLLCCISDKIQSCCTGGFTRVTVYQEVL